MTCPYLAYRDESGGKQFDEPRAYCTAADRFVQPMRADICNDRYDLEHDQHCEIFLEHADRTDGDSTDRTADDATERPTDGGETGGDE